MADGTNPQTAALSAATVKTITLDKDYAVVEVVNLTGTSAVYFTVDGPAPTVAGDNCQALPAAISSLLADGHEGGTTIVRLISAGTPTIHVRGVR